MTDNNMNMNEFTCPYVDNRTTGQKIWDFAQKHPIIFGNLVVCGAYFTIKIVDTVAKNVKFPSKTIYFILPDNK